MDGLHTELALGLIGQLQTAPFVAKTYQMVCEPRTDALIRWGGENNSFVVADVAGFSQLLLPCFFKHGNFSSFVRQLNTYGFRKVHPDRWEFAHESFLRGQTHLLPRIVRRKKRGEGGGSASCSSATIDSGHEPQHVASASSTGDELDLDDDEEEEGSEAVLLEEVQRLRREQTAIGEQLARMSRRLQATERRPDQLMSFLTRLADEDSSVQLLEQAPAEKKRQRMQQMQMQFTPSRDFAAPSSPSPIALRPPPPRPPAVIDDAAMVDGVWRWAEEQKPARRSITTSEQPAASSGAQQVPEFEGGGGSGVGVGLTDDGGATAETPFPFCLLGQCFF